MLKKIVFVAAVLLIAGASYGGVRNPQPGAGIAWNQDGYSEIKGEAWAWSATYDMKPICVMPVKMDIGYWIRVVNAKDDGAAQIKLMQTSVHKYRGFTTLDVLCNVAIDLDAFWTKTTDMGLNVDFGPNVIPSHLEATGTTAAKVRVEFGIKDVDLNAAILTGAKNAVEIGTVTLRVRPSVAPNIAGGVSAPYDW